MFLFSESDSVSHSIIAKQSRVEEKSRPPAGVFTQPFATQYVILTLKEEIEKEVIKEKEVMQERLKQFLDGFGKQFYKATGL